MTTATAATTHSPRLLTPTTEYFRHDGEPFARLSPHKSLKNAAVIYNSIKNLPDKTIVRGDFDKKSQPIIFFPERTKKKIGQIGNVNTIKAGDINAGRKEMAGFLSSIAIEGVHFKDSAIRKTALMLNRTVSLTESDQRDFTVGDIKESLKALAKAYHTDQLHKTTSPHRLLGRQVTKIQNKRLREFVAISREKADEIYTAIRGNLKKYDVQPEMGLFAIKVMIRQFLDQDSLSSKSFASFVRQNAHDPDIQFFAQRWHAISHPFPSDERIQFSTEPWAKELDTLCEIIIKSNRRSTRLMKVDTAEGGGSVTKLVLPTSTSKQPQELPQADKVIYSSLKSEDTDDSSSFPSSPYHPKQSSSSSTASVGAAPLVTTQVSEQPPELLVVPESPKLSDYFNNVSEQDDSDTAFSAQSTLSPANENKTVMSLGEKFKSQLSALSHSTLPSFESDASLNQSEKTRLLNNTEESSKDQNESATTEEKM